MSSVRLDLHVHTIHSVDSIIKPHTLIDYVKKGALDGISITDHNNLNAYNSLKKIFEKEELILIPGMEIDTHIGEVIGLFIENEINTIGLTGGVSYNYLFSKSIKMKIMQSGLSFIEHEHVPPGDAGISTGQLIGGIFRYNQEN